MSGERCFAYCGQAAPAVQPEELNRRRNGQPNRISTVRFTPLTWLPKSLFVQFQRAANVYFLVVSILVCMPWSPTMWSSSVLPFAAVLLWTALKDLYEDMRRRRDDDAENMRSCWRFDFASGKFVSVRWQEVLCGDLLLSLQDEAFPADMAILGASQGQAFISTANLDGESNLKERRAADVCSALAEHCASGSSEAGGPSDDAAAFEEGKALAELALAQGLSTKFDAPKAGPTEMQGSVSLRTTTAEVTETLQRLQVLQPCSLHFEHFVPRGCVLRNTPWVLAVAAYVGDETQARLSVQQVKAKISNLQVHLNRCVKGLVVTLAVFCLYAAIMAQALQDDMEAVDFLKSFFKYWIILYQIVPISLYVCFEIVKLLLGFQINLDKQMVDPVSKKGAFARTADLVEELGQVRHVFSDKTGTLTQNEMRFARACIGGKDLGEFRFLGAQAGAQAGGESSTCGKTSSLEAVTFTPVLPVGTATAQHILAGDGGSLCEETRRFFLCLVACHDAQVELGSDGSPRFSGSSPDEVAFLEAAHQVGYTLRARKAASGNSSGAELEIDGPDGVRTLTVICQVPFDSDRKRMTVVCEFEGQYLCFTKGADSVMGPLCEPGSLAGGTKDHLELYAKLGLRTLVIAWKALQEDVALDWRRQFEEARNAAHDRDGKLADCAANMEHSLRLCGISAIEDRLQDGVPRAISTLKEMGILVWVLTGDKTETAVEIARSCELLQDEMSLVSLVHATSTADALGMLRDGLATLKTAPSAALVLDGGFAKYALADAQAKLLLYDLAMACKACVCCRLTPQQKRELVQMARERDQSRITLAIGDGANDVAMIQGAHVGVAVRGKEGCQAVQASDVAISQFRFLLPLLHCHGRRAYRRVATFLCYYVYKHVVLAVGDMCWAHESRFAGEIAYPEWLSSAYSVLFTSLPVIVVVGFDCDLPDEVALVLPELYEEGLRRIHFNARVFVSWMLSGIWHGSLAWLVPSLVLGAAGADTKDWGGTFWVSSCTSFSLVIICVSLQLWLISLNPLALKTLAVLSLSFLAYLITLLVLGHSALGAQMQWQIEGAPLEMAKGSRSLLVLCLTPFALLADASAIWALMYFRPTPLVRARWHSGKLSRVAPQAAAQALEAAEAAAAAAEKQKASA